MPETVLDRRTLNRTFLARQGLLRREPRAVAAAIEHLVGMQSQVPRDPFVALWSRIEGFDPAELDRLMTERAAVRTGLMRTTLHLVTSPDALVMRIAGAWYEEDRYSRGKLFVDGFLTGGWRIDAKPRTTPRLVIDLFRRLTTEEQSAVDGEADALLRFLTPDAEHRSVEMAVFG